MRFWNLLTSGLYTDLVVFGTILTSLLIIESLLGLIIVGNRKLNKVYLVTYCVLSLFIGLFLMLCIIVLLDNGRVV